MEDLYNSLKEGIIEAFIGIIQGLKSSEKGMDIRSRLCLSRTKCAGRTVNLIGPYVQPMFTMAEQIAGLPNRPESLTRCLAGMVG